MNALVVRVKGCISPDGLFWPCERCSRTTCHLEAQHPGFSYAEALVQEYPQDLDAHCSNPFHSPLRLLDPRSSEV